MRVAKNGWFSSFVGYGTGMAIGVALIVGFKWSVSVSDRLTALEARPPVRREWIIEKMHGVDPVEMERFYQQGSDGSADNEDRHPDEDLVAP